MVRVETELDIILLHKQYLLVFDKLNSMSENDACFHFYSTVKSNEVMNDLLLMKAQFYSCDLYILIDFDECDSKRKHKNIMISLKSLNNSLFIKESLKSF